RAALQDRRIGTKPHRAAHFAADPPFLQLVALHPFRHEADDRLVRGDKLSRVRSFDATKGPRRLNDSHLHSKADAEIRHTALAGQTCGTDFTFGTALAETARYQNPVDMFEKGHRILVLEDFTLDPVEIDLHFVGHAAM